MKVLHITSWYPNDLNAQEALWIQRHIEALAPHVEENFVVHLEVKGANSLRFHRANIACGIRRRLEIPVKIWFLLEVITALLLVYYLIRCRAGRFNVINFHIAYPSLVYWHVLKRWFKVPVVITEHWSAYHYHFGVPRQTDLSRIKKIFRQKIPLITVSDALAQDIRDFTSSVFPVWIVPNVTDEAVFYRDNSALREDFFFMVSQWKWPKEPIVVFKAFKEFLKTQDHFQLKVAGFGPDYPEMVNWVRDNGMQNSILFLGSLHPFAIAALLRTCRAFLHSSNYETFSVVCAEAIGCGTPVLASKVGGILEVVRNTEGILLDSQETLAWTQGMHAVLDRNFFFNDACRFSKLAIGRAYYAALAVVSGVTVDSELDKVSDLRIIAGRNKGQN